MLVKDQSFLHRSVLRCAIHAIAKVLDPARRAGPLAILCLAALALGGVRLTKVSGAFATPATPQAGGGGGKPTDTCNTIDVPPASTGIRPRKNGVISNIAGSV